MTQIKSLRFWLFSLLGIMAVWASVIANDLIVRPQNMILISDSGQASWVRNVASQSSSGSSTKDEHLFAHHLASNTSRRPASLANEAKLLDQLQFAELMGRYRLFSHPQVSHRLWKLEFYQGLNPSFSPVQISDLAGFITKYGPTFAINFEKAKFLDQSEQSLRFQLLSSKGEPMGLALVQLSEQGQLLSLEIN